MNDLTSDYVMTANIVTIAVCLLLTVVWLVLRVGNAAIVLCHSACALLRLWVAWAVNPSASTQMGAVGSLANEQSIPPTIVGTRPPVQRVLALVGENTDSGDKGSATSLPTNFIAKSCDCQQGSAALPSTSTRAVLASTRAAGPTAPRRRERNRSAPERKRAAKVRLSPLSSGGRTQRMNADEVRRVVTAFKCWMIERRLTGRQIAVSDVWAEALNFARAENIALPKHDRFLEMLAKMPGVIREYDVRLDGETKTTAYIFSPLAKHGSPTGEIIGPERVQVPC